MRQNRIVQTLDKQANEAVLAARRALIRDARAYQVWLEATLEALEAIEADSRAFPHDNDGGNQPQSAAERPAIEAAELGRAVAVLDDHSTALLAATELVTESVREQGDRIDAVLADIRRVRAQTLAV